MTPGNTSWLHLHASSSSSLTDQPERLAGLTTHFPVPQQTVPGVVDTGISAANEVRLRTVTEHVLLVIQVMSDVMWYA